jgi:hypothetical protein
LPPRAKEVRKVLRRNRFVHERGEEDEIWIRRNAAGGVEAKTKLSKGNKEIRSPSLFADILRQSKKTRQEFFEVLRS